MKRKLLIVISCIAIAMTSMSMFSFANTSEGKTISDVTELKKAIVKRAEGGVLTNSEKRELLQMTEDVVVEEFISEKLDEAVRLINKNSGEISMQQEPNGIAYSNQRYDLGDACELVIEFSDRAEEQNDTSLLLLPPVLRSTSGSQNLWKEYGNRYFTAKATVNTAVGNISLTLENHYALSANGITARYGTPGNSSTSTRVAISSKKPVISKSGASKVGSSIGIYGDFNVVISNNGTKKSAYRIQTEVECISIDKAAEKIKVGQSWNLSKIS